ncbi:MAG: GNAT family N-acetyltransferase [Myxococcales bacterium]|nr:GNAT family N-acetyltransferase [Myxococcales bacterium]
MAPEVPTGVSGFTLRFAKESDVPTIHRLIVGLADYEKLRHEVVANEADIRRDLFGDTPRVFCDLAEWDGEAAGFALWFYTYSTFLGRHGIWLEDLFVYPGMRGKGFGKGLLTHLARRCVDEGLGRFEWAVLDWNTPSIDFYRSQGAVMVDGWERCRVSGEALRRLGAA